MKAILLYVLFALGTIAVVAQPSAGLVAHWDMNGSTDDVSGNGHNGHGRNLTPAPGSDGVMGHAWYFNGVNSAISIPYSPAFNVSRYTIVAKVNVKGFYAGPCHYNMIFMRGRSGGPTGGGGWYYLAFSDAPAGLGCAGSLDSSLDCFSSIAYSSSTWMGPSPFSSFNYTPHIAKDTWYTVVATFNDTVYKIYVNNVLKSTSVITTPGEPMASGTDSACIGFDIMEASAGYSYAFKGYIDDIFLYNRVLPDSEVVQFADSCGAVSFNPVSVTVPEGGTATYHTDATILGAAYQWQVNDGTGFTNLFNGGQYSGVTTNALTITGVTASMNGYHYRCAVSNYRDMPCADTSIAALLMVSALGVNDVAANEEISIYPNPAHAELTVVSSGNAEILISDLLGRNVYQGSLHKEKMTISVAGLPAGVYMILVSSDKGNRAIKKFVKE